MGTGSGDIGYRAEAGPTALGSPGGLISRGARFYDTSTGRFLNRDPLGYGGGLNLYGYADDDPVDGVDPSGLDAGPKGPNSLALSGYAQFLTGPYIGVDPKRHNMNFRMIGPGWRSVRYRVISGGMTPAQKALGFPENSLSVHTERKVCNAVGEVPDETSLEFVGQKAPCTNCKGAMNKLLRDSGAPVGAITYKWRENGKTNAWIANGGRGYKAPTPSVPTQQTSPEPEDSIPVSSWGVGFSYDPYRHGEYPDGE